MPDSPTPPISPYYIEEDEFSLIDLWNIVWKRKWPWLSLGPLFAILGIFYAVDQADIYQAEATLVPNFEEERSSGLSGLASQFGGFASLAGINMGGENSTATALATLNSRQFLTPFLTQQKNLQALFPGEWDASAEKWTIPNKRRGADNRPSDLEAYERFTNDHLKVSEDKKTGLVNLAVQSTDPEQAAIWTNQLVSMLNEHLRKQAKTEAEKNLAYLNRQLTETRVLEIKESLYSLIESQTKNAMLANAKDEYAFKVIDPAVTPEIRVSPKRTLIVVAAGMLGGFFGLFLCFVLHFVDTAKKQGSTLSVPDKPQA